MRRSLALILSAALALSLAGCGASAPRPGGPTPAGRTAYALKEPVYPDFPAMPKEPKGDNWDAYFKEYDAYCDALRKFRGDGLDPETAERLTAFTQKSAPLALAGHEGENAIYSPLSLWSALALLAQCAGGDSRAQVLSALESDSVESLRDWVSQIWHGLYTDDGANALLTASSIWLNSAMEGSYVQDTLDGLAERYYAGTYHIPMGSGEADQAVTDWVMAQTRGLIGADSPVVQTQADTLALLVSSLYYKAGWRDKFRLEQTSQDVFTAAAGRQDQVDFMHRTQTGSFLLGDGWQAAALSTALGEMVFVLPGEGLSPEQLLRDGDLLSRLEFGGGEARWGEIQWSVPKFDVSSQLDLMGTLTAMGITDLTDQNRADLSALTDLDAYLSGASQMARVKVDEEGVEAAAVTILETATSGMLDSGEVCVMDLNRPFLFVIRMDGAPLFVGVVNQAGG